MSAHRHGFTFVEVIACLLVVSLGVAAAVSLSVYGQVLAERAQAKATGMATAISLNFSLVNDLLRNPEDSGKAMAILVVGGNSFGIVAPIVTGHVIQLTGSYNWAFGIAGLERILRGEQCVTGRSSSEDFRHVVQRLAPGEAGTHGQLFEHIVGTELHLKSVVVRETTVVAGADNA